MANEKILVVDDDKNICELLRLYLVKEGYSVTMAHDGEAALTDFDKLHPDLVLLDAGEGGTGETFDWSLLAGIRRPYFLAGGLHPGNVGQAVRRLRPFGVDVSSGIETDGKKDPAKMEAFVRAVREEEMI